MKNIIKILTLAAAVVVASVQQSNAQGVVTLPVMTVAASVASNAVWSSAHVIDVRRQQNVAIEWTFGLAGAGSGITSVSFTPSLDGTTLTTAFPEHEFILARAANGTTRVTVATNLNVKGYNYLVVGVVSNASANILTNTIRYVVKPSAP